MRRIWHDFGLSIALVILFTVSLALQTWMGWNEFVAEQRDHGTQPQAFGEDGYIWRWGESTFENWQSEFLQIFWTATGLAFLYAFGSSESKDSDERLESKMDEILKRLDA